MEKQNNCSNVGKKIEKYICDVLWKHPKDIKEPLKTRSITAFATEKNETSPLILERKLKISAKLYEKVVKTPKKHWKHVWKLD